jgi:tetratricopeptide (TPR) repeat protein
LAVLQSLPETPERVQQEIKLRIVRAFSLMAIKGFASDDVEAVFAGGRELFWLQGPSPELFHMLWSLNLHYQFKGEVRSSLEVSRLLLELAQDIGDGALLMEAHRAMGATLVILGRCVEALRHLESSAALYPKHRNHSYSALIGLDSNVMCECFAGLALWALGDTEWAAQRTLRALELARELGEPQTLVVAGHCAAQLHHLRGETALFRERAMASVDVAAEYGLELWQAYSAIDLAWVEAELGRTDERIARLQDALDAYTATGAKLWSSYFLQLLAGQLAKAGRLDEALATVDHALEYVAASGEEYALAELHRLRGELIFKTGDRPPTKKGLQMRRKQAQACFAEALAIAKRQQSKSWESRIRQSMKLVDECP